MTQAKTLQQWRPHLLVYFYFILPVVLLGAACSWGVMQCFPRVGTAAAILVGVGSFVVALWLSLRRCSTPELPSFRGLLLVTSYMTIGMGTLSLIVVVP